MSEFLEKTADSRQMWKFGSPGHFRKRSNADLRIEIPRKAS